jgi:hypothetical protein
MPSVPPNRADADNDRRRRHVDTRCRRDIDSGHRRRRSRCHIGRASAEEHGSKNDRGEGSHALHLLLSFLSIRRAPGPARFEDAEPNSRKENVAVVS